MQKVQSINPIKITDCSFCFSPSQEIKIILKACILQIRTILQQKKYRQMHAEQHNSSSEYSSSISRLVRVLFQKQQFQIIYSKGCCHSRLMSLLRQKLKCKNEHLQFLIEQLCDKLARRNYQLEIVSFQVKNVENSVLQLDEQTQLQSSKIKYSQSRQSEQNKAQSQQAVKIEEGQKVHQVSPPTAINYNISFDNMPLGYNILFYGGAYYQ